MPEVHEVDKDMDYRLEDMIYDIGESYFRSVHIYDTLCSDKDTPLRQKGQLTAHLRQRF